MPERKVGIGYKFINWITRHPWLKLISLILAIIVWFYVKEEMNRFNY